MQLTKYLEEPLNPRALPDEAPGEACKIVVGDGGADRLLAREKHIVFIGELKEILNEQVKKQVLLAKQTASRRFCGGAQSHRWIHLVAGS